MKKTRAISAFALIAGASLALAACGGGGSGGSGSGGTGKSGGNASGLGGCNASTANTCNSAPVKDGGTLTYSIEKNIEHWNVDSATGNVFETVEVLDSVLPEAFNQSPDLGFAVDKRYVQSASVTKTDPQTVVYKLNPKAQWSDGTPFSAKDFIYQWKTQNTKDCPKCEPATTSGYDRVKSVEGSDNGKTVTVTFSKPFTDWQSLFTTMLPAHIAAKHGDMNTPAGLAKSFQWFDAHVPTYSAGPFKIDQFQNNKAVILTPNPKWQGDGPHLDKIVFRIITDASAEPAALQNGEIDFMYPQPELDLINQVKAMNGVSYVVSAGLNWEHFDLNLAKPELKNPALRSAIFTAINRKELKAKTVDQFTDNIKIDNSHVLVPGLDGYQDNVTTVSSHGQGKTDEAKKMLTDAGYKIAGGKLMTPSGSAFPALTCKYTSGNQIRKTECELIARQLKPLGISMSAKPISDLGGTLAQGQFQTIVYAWVGTPFPFAGAEQIWTLDGGNDFGKFDDPQVDKLLGQAAAQTDRQKAMKLLNQADKLITKGSYSLPLYQKPTMLAGSDKFANIRDNPSSVGPPYNTQEWGIRK